MSSSQKFIQSEYANLANKKKLSSIKKILIQIREAYKQTSKQPSIELTLNSFMRIQVIRLTPLTIRSFTRLVSSLEPHLAS